MRAARFGRVKNTLSMGFGASLETGDSSVLCCVGGCLTNLAHIISSEHSVGLPNVGKSTLTNLLTGANHAEAANYPFCTIDPNVVQCIVPDKNFQYLADTWKPPSVVPAVLKVTDIAGLIKGASEGAGLGNAFLSHIAAVDGIYHLIRAFDSDEVIHVDDSVDPVRDMETITEELCLKDSAVLAGVIDKEKERIRKEKGKAKSAEVEVGDTFQQAYDKCKQLLDSKTPIQTYSDFSAAEVDCIRDWGVRHFISSSLKVSFFNAHTVLTFSSSLFMHFSHLPVDHHQARHLRRESQSKEFYSQRIQVAAQNQSVGRQSRWRTDHTRVLRV